MNDEAPLTPLVTLSCPEPPSGNVWSRMHWGAKKRLRRRLYAHLLVSLRANHRWERHVLHPHAPDLASRRRVVFTRHAGPGTGVRRYDDGRWREGCGVVLDIIQVDRVRRPGLGLIYSDAPRWLDENYVQDATGTAGVLRVEVYEAGDAK